jgi:hypothetical protein
VKGRALPAVALALFVLAGCDDGERASAPDGMDVVSLAELGWEAEFGLADPGNPLALLNRVRDAVVVQDEILILDGSPPWVRVFDRSGAFVRSMVLAGDGPGEARNPLSITGTGTDEFLLGEATRITRFDREGNHLQTAPLYDYLVRGALSVCDDAVITLARARGESATPPGLLLRLSGNGVLLDTLVVLDPMREQVAPAVHPAFLSSRGRDLLVYSEEAERDRLLTVDCDDGELQTILLPPLGTPGRWGPYPEPDGPGIAQYPAGPPLPAGALPVGDSVLWAAQVVVEAPEPDSLTVLSLLARDGTEVGRLVVQGWIMLLDGTEDGAILIRARDPVDRVLLVRLSRVLAILSDPERVG